MLTLDRINSAFLLTFYYLPIYFRKSYSSRSPNGTREILIIIESIQGVSAAASGIRTVPYILAVSK